MPIDSLTLLPGNPRRGDIDAVARSLSRFGQRKPVIVTRDGTVLAGNHTVLAARALGWTSVAALPVDDDEATGKAFALADNRTAALGGFDDEALAAMLAEVQAADPELLEAASYSEGDLHALLAEAASGPRHERPTMADKFLVPPFTVLNGRTGWWRERKAHWLTLGIRSEVGRPQDKPGGGGGAPGDVYLGKRADGTWTPMGVNAVNAPAGRTAQLVSATPAYRDSDFYRKKKAAEADAGRALTVEEFTRDHWQPVETRPGIDTLDTTGTSVFDPVLCELVYRWFCPAGGAVLDPWAGGSVRGLVAALLGRTYTGCELRAEQVQANQEQAPTVLGPDPQTYPLWLLGDCRDTLPSLPAESYDLVFGCPPYFDLERYSDDPRDLSVMDRKAYEAAYRDMITTAAVRLRPDRFAVLVVSSVRGAAGRLRDLHGLTVDACAAAGLDLYNEAVLLTAIGSLPVRAGQAFERTRVLGRAHQDVLVFIKGDRHAATAACGTIDGLADTLAAFTADDEEL